MDKIQLINQRDHLLEQISRIPTMRRGKITVSSPVRTRSDGTRYQAGPYYKFQRWEKGRNRTDYVPADEYLHLKESVDNYHTYRALCDELAEVVEILTLLDEAPETKKKRRSTSKSNKPATTKSKPS
jgi:hypothetical protein